MSHSPLHSPLSRALDRIARANVPDDLDLWPAISRRLRQVDTAAHGSAARGGWAQLPPTTPRAPGHRDRPIDAAPGARDHGWVNELLKIAAAAIVIGIVGALLVFVFRGTNSNQVGPPAPTETPTPTATPTLSPSPTVRAVVAAAPSVASATATPELAGTITSIPVGAVPKAIAIDSTALWVANSLDGTVSRIDPSTNQVVATIQVADPGTDSVYAIAAGDGSVWVSALGQAEIVRIDPATNQPSGAVPVDGAIYGLNFEDGSLWARAFYSNRILRIDPATNSVAASIPVDAPWSVAVTGGALWVTRQLAPADLVKIDLATNEVVATVPLGDVPFPQVTHDGTALWTLTRDSALRIDAESAAVIATVPLPEGVLENAEIFASDGTVWIVALNGLWRLDPGASDWSHVGRLPTMYAERQGWLGNGSFWFAMTDDTVMRVDPRP